MHSAIEIANLRKSYPGGVEALRGLDLSTAVGEVFCLVGQNGAGKTTALRVVGTQLLPTSGTVRVFGRDAVREPGAIRPLLATVPQEAAPDPELTVWEHVSYYLRARGQTKREAAARSEAVLTAMRMWDRRDQPAFALSGGLRKRVLLCMALASEASLLLLDEPTASLDPIARRSTWDLLLKEKASRSILLTTHSMGEAEALADRVGFIDRGQLAAVGTVQELKRRLPSQEKVCLRSQNGWPDLARFGEFRISGQSVVVYPFDREALQAVVSQAVLRRLEVSVEPATLEDVYLRLLGG